jgi:hypothetical protein
VPRLRLLEQRVIDRRQHASRNLGIAPQGEELLVGERVDRQLVELVQHRAQPRQPVDRCGVIVGSEHVPILVQMSDKIKDFPHIP